MSSKMILSVGQCLADEYRLSQTLTRHWDVHVEAVESEGAAVRALEQSHFDLVLINRVFDADGFSGLQFLRRIKADAVLRETKVMLISNLATAQAEAVAAGAIPGFGKAELEAAKMFEALGSTLGQPNDRDQSRRRDNC